MKLVIRTLIAATSLGAIATAGAQQKGRIAYPPSKATGQSDDYFGH